MADFFTKRLNKNETIAQKGSWLIGFVAFFMSFYTVLDLIWNEFFAGKGFYIDVQMLPCGFVSAVVIGILIMNITSHSVKLENSRK